MVLKNCTTEILENMSLSLVFSLSSVLELKNGVYKQQLAKYQKSGGPIFHFKRDFTLLSDSVQSRGYQVS